ncbi:hypothetical protein [Bacillus sp. WP8]|nr:hypothetical protein [Bacillus sp. WP8]
MDKVEGLVFGIYEWADEENEEGKKGVDRFEVGFEKRHRCVVSV